MDFCLRLCQSLLLKPAEENHSLTYVRPAGQKEISAYQHFYQCFILIIKSLEVISMGLHTSELAGNFATASWDHDSKSTDASLLHGLIDFDFMVAFLIVYFFLSHLSGITISSITDINDAYQQIDEIKIFYSERRKNIDEHFHKIYEKSERMATAVDVQPSKPRSCTRQRHRPSAEAETIEDLYKVNVAIPFFRSHCSRNKNQFSPMAQTAS